MIAPDQPPRWRGTLRSPGMKGTQMKARLSSIIKAQIWASAFSDVLKGEI
jgi:hypothetical protein